MNTKKNLLCILFVLLISPRILLAVDLQAVRARTDCNWCWAAAIRCVCLYYSVKFDQCTIVTNVCVKRPQYLSQAGTCFCCCDHTPCKEYFPDDLGKLRQIYEDWSFSFYRVSQDTPIPISDLEEFTQIGTPIAAFNRWDEIAQKYIGHVVVISSASDTTNIIHVMDPLYGSFHDWTYSEMSS